MIEFFLEIPTQNNTYSFKNPVPFSSGSPQMQDIRVGISKKYVIIYPYFYTYPG